MGWDFIGGAVCGGLFVMLLVRTMRLARKKREDRWTGRP